MKERNGKEREEKRKERRGALWRLWETKGWGWSDGWLGPGSRGQKGRMGIHGKAARRTSKRIRLNVGNYLNPALLSAPSRSFPLHPAPSSPFPQLPTHRYEFHIFLPLNGSTSFFNSLLLPSTFLSPTLHILLTICPRIFQTNGRNLCAQVSLVAICGLIR